MKIKPEPLSRNHVKSGRETKTRKGQTEKNKRLDKKDDSPDETRKQAPAAGALPEQQNNKFTS